MDNRPFTPDQVARFHDDGYLFVEQLLDPEEVDLLHRVGKADRMMSESAFALNDSAGRSSRLMLRTHLAHDIYSAVAASHRLVDAAEQLLDGEVYHWHHKMMLKEPEVGGAWEWHQDYGYWYHDGCLYPRLISCMIAVDRAYKGNGCLQVLRGSHRLGRLDHGQVGAQTGADAERVEAAVKQLELVHCEMPPGTGLFFHCNLLHCSAANTSPDPRWTFICCYNAADNSPYKSGPHPAYTPLEKWPDERIKALGREQLRAMEPQEETT